MNSCQQASLHKAIIGVDLVFQVQSEYWVLMLFWCRKSNCCCL